MPQNYPVRWEGEDLQILLLLIILTVNWLGNDQTLGIVGLAILS